MLQVYGISRNPGRREKIEKPAKSPAEDEWQRARARQQRADHYVRILETTEALKTRSPWTGTCAARAARTGSTRRDEHRTPRTNQRNTPSASGNAVRSIQAGRTDRRTPRSCGPPTGIARRRTAAAATMKPKVAMR